MTIVQYSTIQYHTIPYHTISYHNNIQYIIGNTLHYNTLQYTTIQYNTLHYNTIQYNTKQYNTIQYSRTPGKEYIDTASKSAVNQTQNWRRLLSNTTLPRLETPWPGLRQRLPGEPIVNVNSTVCSRHVSVEQLNEHINYRSKNVAMIYSKQT